MVLLVAVAIVTSVFSYRLSIKKNEAEENARKAEQARVTTSEQRALALKTVRGVLFKVDDLMRNDAKLYPVRMQIIQAMLKDLDEIRDHALKNPLDDRTEAVAFSRIGEIYFRAGRVKDAHDWMTMAYPLLKANADANPTDPDVLYNLSGITNQIADVEWRLGNGTKARDLYAEALEIRKQRPRNDRIQESIAISHRLIAFADLRLGDNASAESNYLTSEAMYAKLPADRLRNLFVRRDRAENLVRLADARFRLGKLPQATTHYDDALKERRELLRMTPQEPYTSQLKNDIALSLLAIGDFRFMAYDDAVGTRHGRVCRRL